MYRTVKVTFDDFSSSYSLLLPIKEKFAGWSSSEPNRYSCQQGCHLKIAA